MGQLVFGGHHVPGYSLLFPALAATPGPSVVGVASVITSSALFAALVRDQAAGRRRAIAWSACAAAGDLFIGRLTFALGVSLAMGCLLATARGRPRSVTALGISAAVASPVASPVAGLLLSLVLLGWIPPLPRNWRLTLIVAPAGAAAVLSISFPEGGVQLYPTAAAFGALALTLAVAASLPAAMRAARRGTLLYAAAILATYLVPSPMGSNVTRLGVLAAGPLLVLGLRRRPSPRRRVAVAALASAIAAWQLWAPVTETLKASGSGATSAEYFAPLTQQLETLSPRRVEVVPTATRWESVYVANRVPLARGWETQLHRRYNARFYKARLPAKTYLQRLRHLAGSYVAVSDGPKERWGRLEARLLASPPPGLREVCRGAHWRLFAVIGTPPLVARRSWTPGVARTAGVTVSASRPGAITVRVRYTRFWQAGGRRLCHPNA